MTCTLEQLKASGLAFVVDEDDWRNHPIFIDRVNKFLCEKLEVSISGDGQEFTLHSKPAKKPLPKKVEVTEAMLDEICAPYVSDSYIVEKLKQKLFGGVE